MPWCVAVEYNNNIFDKNREKDDSFYKLPKDVNLRKRWVLNIKRENIPKNLKIFHQYLEDSSFKRDLDVNIIFFILSCMKRSVFTSCWTRGQTILLPFLKKLPLLFLIWYQNNIFVQRKGESNLSDGKGMMIINIMILYLILDIVVKQNCILDVWCFSCYQMQIFLKGDDVRGS